MPPVSAASPPMSQVPRSGSSRLSPGPSPAALSYPGRPPLQPPPRAHLHQHSHGPSHDSAHVLSGKHRDRGSISSDATESSSVSHYKAHPAAYPCPSFAPSPPREKAMTGDPSELGHKRASRHGSPRQLTVRAPSTIDETRSVRQYRPEPDDDGEEPGHAIQVLIWLLFFDPVLSLMSAAFSVVAAVAIILASPGRLCHPSYSISTSIIRALAPLFRYHLRMMWAPSVDHAHTFDFKPVTLVLVQLVSPLLSVGVALVAWISAAFWLFTLMMGNPDGTERRDDGRAAVLALRNWWERYLLSAVR